MRMPRLVAFGLGLALVVAADQGTKAWAHTLSHGAHPVIAGYWDWELAYNDGAAFSNFRGKTALLSAIAMLAIAAITYLALASTTTRRARIAYALLAGGALGNLLDRLRDGAVTDFVRWRLGDHAWPVFNVADVALVAGVAGLLIDAAISRRAAASSA